MIARRLLVAALAAVSLTACGVSPAAPTAAARIAGDSAAFAAGKAGLTPAMITAIAKLLDANGDGQLSKDEGMVELQGPEKPNGKLLSNYYDEKWQHGAHVKPLPVKTFTESLGKGYVFGFRAIRGDKEENGYSYVPMTAKELDRFCDGMVDILEGSPLYKKGLLGGEIAVNHVVIPHFLFRKPKNAVETWSMRKLADGLHKRLADRTQIVRFHPEGKHEQGAFVVQINDFPAVD
jgi:hypothetical protein